MSPLWSTAKRHPLRMLVIVVAVSVALTGLVLLNDIEGDTYAVDLTNNTQERLRFHACGGGCDEEHLVTWVEAGDKRSANGALGVLNLWQVRNEEGVVMGCFRLDVEERSQVRDLSVSRDLEPCSLNADLRRS